MTEMVPFADTAGAMSVALLLAGLPRFVIDRAQRHPYLWYGENKCPSIDRSGITIHGSTTTFHRIAA